MVSVIRIMLVDDFKPWRGILRSIVKPMEGCRVVAEAGDGVEAIEKAGLLRPDIVLLDIGLPRLNGIEAAPRIRRISPGSKIVFLTQEHDSDLRAAAFAAGADGYLLKTMVLSELRHTIDAALKTPSRHSAEATSNSLCGSGSEISRTFWTRPQFSPESDQRG
jgi:DNA-binding NarL/FixJ family response regulator